MLTVPLADDTPPGGRLARLDGVVAVAVMARLPDPLEVALGGAAEKTVQNDAARLTIHEAIVKPNQYAGELELTFETTRPAATLLVQGPGIPPVELRSSLDQLQYQLEIVDDQGQAKRWSYLKPPPEGSRGRMRLQVQGQGPEDRADFAQLRLRAYAVVGAAVEVPVSFRDVELP